MNFSDFNKRRFNIDTTGFQYSSLADLYNNDGKDHIYIVRAVFMSMGKYGETPLLATDTTFVNLPKHCTSVCNTILNSTEAIAGINEGKCGFKIRQYHSEKYNKNCYAVDFIDINDSEALLKYL